MATTRIAWINAILIFCLALTVCDGGKYRPKPKGGLIPRAPRGGYDPSAALARARGIAMGNRYSNVKVFNVLDFGAKADGRTDSAMHFINAFRAACNFGGEAMLLIPQGNFLIGPVLFQGPCKNPSSLIVKVTGIVKAVDDISEFPGAADGTEWITFKSINGLIVTGTGTFDGQGSSVWQYNDCRSNNDCVRMPANIKFMYVTNAIIRGITSVNPKGFHMFLTFCSNFRIFSIHLLAPASSPNTDGIHISRSNLVKISKSNIATGDDCVSMIQGATNISIKKVFCGPGHGFSIGSLGHYQDELDVSGIVVKNSTLSDTENGLRIKTYKACPPSKAFGIVFQDIIMYRVRNPIIIDQEYGNRVSSKPSMVSINDVHYINIKGTTTTNVAVDIVCSKSAPCNGIHLNNVNLQYVGLPSKIPFSSVCANARVDYFGFQSPVPCK